MEAPGIGYSTGLVVIRIIEALEYAIFHSMPTYEKRLQEKDEMITLLKHQLKSQ